MGTSPAIDLWTFGYGNDVATTLPLEVFTESNFVADFFREKLNFTGTNSDIAFLCHLLGDLGVTYTVHLYGWLESAWSTNVLIELFSLAITIEAL